MLRWLISLVVGADEFGIPHDRGDFCRPMLVVTLGRLNWLLSPFSPVVDVQHFIVTKL